MSEQCAGHEGRDLGVTEVACPVCGADLELFSDEKRVKCHVCGAWVNKDGSKYVESSTD
jgi:exosome complex RNA-binding protein Csl4